MAGFKTTIALFRLLTDKFSPNYKKLRLAFPAQKFANYKNLTVKIFVCVCLMHVKSKKSKVFKMNKTSGTEQIFTNT